MDKNVKKINWPDDFIDKIICGDCLEVMNQMPDKCLDLVVTSPPYNLKNSTGNGMKDGRGGKWANAALQNGYANHDDCIHPLVSTEPKEGKPERYYAIGGNGLNSLYEVSVNEDGYLVYWDRGSLKTKGYSTLPDSWLSSVGNHPVIRNNVKYFNYGAVVFSSQESKEFGISSLINSYKKEFIERKAVFMLLTGLKKAGGLS